MKTIPIQTSEVVLLVLLLQQAELLGPPLYRTQYLPLVIAEGFHQFSAVRNERGVLCVVCCESVLGWGRFQRGRSRRGGPLLFDFLISTYFSRYSIRIAGHNRP